MVANQTMIVACEDLSDTPPVHPAAVITVRVVASPKAPSGVQSFSLCTNSLTIQWTPATSGFNASSYNISVTSGTTVGTWSVAGDTTMTTIGDLIDGTSYTVSITAINCAGSAPAVAISVQTFSVSVTTVLYQNNSVYNVELLWTHRQSCSVLQYTVIVTSGAAVDMSSVDISYCNASSCSYVQSISGANVSSYNVSVACRNTLNQTGQPYVAMQSVPTPALQVGLSYVIGLAGSGYLSSTNGPSVSVFLKDLGSNETYYCKAAATNTNSNSCAGPVVGGVKVFFSFMTTLEASSPFGGSAISVLMPSTLIIVAMLIVYVAMAILKGEESIGRRGEESIGRKGEESIGRKGEESFGRRGEESIGRKGEESIGRRGEKAPR
eukprot:Em0006g536a